MPTDRRPDPSNGIGKIDEEQKVEILSDPGRTATLDRDQHGAQTVGGQRRKSFNLAGDRLRVRCVPRQ
jgi:hypothetical protein